MPGSTVPKKELEMEAPRMPNVLTHWKFNGSWRSGTCGEAYTIKNGKLRTENGTRIIGFAYVSADTCALVIDGNRYCGHMRLDAEGKQRIHWDDGDIWLMVDPSEEEYNAFWYDKRPADVEGYDVFYVLH